MAPQLIAGRYRVERELGRGGMGAVWLCRDEMLGREVAVKQIGALPGEAADLARGLREARSSAALQHPNVVSVFDAVDEGETIWLVMEYVPSRTLSQLTREEGPLDPRRAAAIGAQVADGLALAHERGTVHRDVKPGNVLVAEGDHAKISDFGIARSNAADEHRTQTGLLTGTPAYFSPELARGADASPASDVWALGATLYAAVEGRQPYAPRENAIATLAAIAQESPEPPRRAGALAGAIGHMLDPDPEARWSMAQVARELHDVAAGGAGVQDTRADDDGAATQVFPAPAAVAGAAGAGAAAGAPSDPETEPGAETEPEPAPAPVPAPEPGRERQRRTPAGWWVAAVIVVLVLAIGGLVLLSLGDDDGAPSAEDTTSAPSGSPEPSEETEPTEETSEPTEESEPEETEPTEEPEETEPTQGASGGEAVGLVEDYYAVLPGDRDAGWATLSPSLQQQIGRGSYDGFWSTISTVDIVAIQDVGGGSVDVTLTYDGGSRETRRLDVGRVGGELRIVGDRVV